MTQTQPAPVHDAAAAAGLVVPEKAALEGLEDKWSKQWEVDQTYAFDRTKERADVYSIDTPPPTASGTLHFGSVCSYTQKDVIARYQRMRGKEVFYPIGWDDNGLPTERRVQTSSACAATRRCRTTPTSPRPRSPTASGRCRSGGRTSSSSASS